VKRIHYVLLIIGLSWVTADLYLVISNMILRETPLSVVATFLDKLPPKINNPIFVFLWITLLLGWAILIGLGVRPLLRKRKAS